MIVRDGQRLELRLGAVHGERFFDAETAGDPNVGTHRNWMSLQIAVSGKHRGAPEKVLFEVELPISEMGELIAGQSARGNVHWSLDSRKKRMAKAKEKKR